MAGPVLTWIRGRDNFGVFVSPTHKGARMHVTIPGGCITVLLYLILLTYLGVNISTSLIKPDSSRTNFTVQGYEQLYGTFQEQQPFVVNGTEFMIGSRVGSADPSLEAPSYFRVLFYSIEGAYDEATATTTIATEYFETVTCKAYFDWLTATYQVPGFDVDQVVRDPDLLCPNITGDYTIS